MVNRVLNEEWMQNRQGCAFRFNKSPVPDIYGMRRNESMTCIEDGETFHFDWILEED